MSDTFGHPATGSRTPSKGKKLLADSKEKPYWEGKMFEEFAALERPKGLTEEAWEQALSWYRLGHDYKWIKQRCPSWFSRTDDAKKLQLLPLILSKAYISKQREVYGAGSQKISVDLNNIYGFSLERHELEKMFLKWNLTTPKVRELKNTASETAVAQLVVEEDPPHLDEHQENLQTQTHLHIQNDNIRNLEAQVQIQSDRIRDLEAQVRHLQQITDVSRPAHWSNNKSNKFDVTWTSEVARLPSQLTETQGVSQLDIVPFPQFIDLYSTTSQVETSMTDLSHQVNDSSMDEHTQQFSSETTGYAQTQLNHNLVSYPNVHNPYSGGGKVQNDLIESAISNTFSVADSESNSDITDNRQQHILNPHEQYSQSGNDPFQWLGN